MSPAGEIQSITCSYTPTCLCKHHLDTTYSHTLGTLITFNIEKSFLTYPILMCNVASYLFLFFTFSGGERTAGSNPFYASLPHSRGLKFKIGHGCQLKWQTWILVTLVLLTLIEGNIAFGKISHIYRIYCFSKKKKKVVLISFILFFLPKFLEKNIEKKQCNFFCLWLRKANKNIENFVFSHVAYILLNTL